MGAHAIKLGTGVRLLAISAAVTLSLASAKQPNNTSYGNYPGSSSSPPPARAMAPSAAVGLWKTTFGPVKIELNDKSGPGQIRGIWYYKRAGQDVIGDFAGQLRGNVLQFKWREPAVPTNLTGSGYLVFDTRGQRFHGKWWTESRDRTGTWTGWRHASGAPDPGNPNGGYDRRPPPPDQPPYQPNGNQPDGNQPDGNQPDGNQPPPPPPPPNNNTNPYNRDTTTLPPM